MKRSWLIDSLAIFVLTSILILPMYKTIYLDRFGSIESTFISDGRMLLDNLPHRNWQPLWYCGTRADYVYPPALRYGVALLTKALHTSPARAYHIYIALFYALGIVGVYFLIRVGNGSRVFAWLGAAATALFSPSFLFLAEIRNDSVYHAPQRLHALITYGEGPHISALCVLPFVFTAVLLWMRFANSAWIAAAAFAAALVVTNNFYGATALAMSFPVLVWACFVVKPGWRTMLQMAGVGVLAYGLTAWWLVPSYLRVTSENLRLVAQPGNAWSVMLLFCVAVLFGAVSWKLPPRMRSAYGIFVWGGLVFFALDVLGHAFFHFQVAGESTRLIPELDLFFILAAIEVLRWMWAWRPSAVPVWIPRAVVIALVLISGRMVPRYLKHAYEPFPQALNWRDRVEYKTAKWVHENLPGQRVLVFGSIRFWFDAWNNLPQVDGGSQQGVLNLNIVKSQYRFAAESDMDLVRLWLIGLGAEAAIVAEKNSEEIYHDLAEPLPSLWRGAFPILHDDGAGNLFYRVDRRVRGVARIVDGAGMQGLAPIPDENEREALRAYVNAIETEPALGGSKDRLQMTRPNTDEMLFEARVAAGEAILVQETFDVGWHAYSNGQPIPLEKDPMGFMLLRAPPGAQRVHLVFEPTLEIRGGLLISVLSLMLTVALIVIGYRRARATAIPKPAANLER